MYARGHQVPVRGGYTVRRTTTVAPAVPGPDYVPPAGNPPPPPGTPPAPPAGDPPPPPLR
jgi:membrane-anchored mycosin MYCP